MYIFYKAKYFQAFHYYCKLVRHCRSRTEKVLKSNDRGNVITENVFIKIGIMGEFTDDDLKLISKRSGNIAKCVLKLRFRCLLYFLFFKIWHHFFLTAKREIPKNGHIWTVSPLLCFQTDLSLLSGFQVCRTPDQKVNLKLTLKKKYLLFI